MVVSRKEPVVFFTVKTTLLFIYFWFGFFFLTLPRTDATTILLSPRAHF